MSCKVIGIHDLVSSINGKVYFDELLEALRKENLFDLADTLKEEAEKNLKPCLWSRGSSGPSGRRIEKPRAGVSHCSTGEVLTSESASETRRGLFAKHLSFFFMEQLLQSRF